MKTKKSEDLTKAELKNIKTVLIEMDRIQHELDVNRKKVFNMLFTQCNNQAKKKR